MERRDIDLVPKRLLYVVKGPGRGNYFVMSDDDPFSDRLGQAMSLWGARRVARRLLRRGIVKEDKTYRVVESVTIH